MKSAERLIKYFAVTVLAITVLASMLQFHSHDCCGHVRLDCNGYEFVLGCAHHDTDCPQHASGTTGHNHSNHDCPLHFQSPALFSDQRYHEAPAVTFDFVAELTSGVELSDGLSVTDEEVSNKFFHNHKLKFLGVMPLRGSPVCI